MRGSDTVWLTWPNALSLSRIFLALGIAYLLSTGQNAILCLWLIALACTTDIADGALARYLEQQSGFGRMLDPICDAFFLVVVFCAMVLNGMMPWSFFLFVIARYFVLMLLHAHLHHLGHEQLGALWSGKICAFSCVSLMVLIFVHNAFPILLPQPQLTNLYFVVEVILLVSFLDYLRRYLHLLRYSA